MRVLYNATSARVGGGLTYATSQLNALAEIEGLELTVLCAPWNRTEFTAIAERGPRVRLQPVRVPNAAVRFAWEQVWLPVLARRHDVLLCPGNFSPLVAGTPTVVVLQNANYVGEGRRLEQNAAIGRRAKVALSHWSMRRSDLVVAVSKALAAEIRAEPDLEHVSLEVIPSGAPSATVAPDATAGPDPDPVDRLVGTQPYLLSVASDYPHKRLSDVARLVPLLQDLEPDVPRHVVVAGAVTDERRRELRSLAHPHEDQLTFLGTVGDRATMLELTRRAAASIATTELESWGLTLHEAGSVGCRLVVTDIPAHREVADGHADFFPVGDLAALAAALQRALALPPPVPWTFDWTWAEHGRELAGALGRVAQ